MRGSFAGKTFAMDAYTFSQLELAMGEYARNIQRLQVNYGGNVVNMRPDQVLLSPIEMIMVLGDGRVLDYEVLDEVVLILKNNKELFFNYFEAG